MHFSRRYLLHALTAALALPLIGAVPVNGQGGSVTPPDQQKTASGTTPPNAPKRGNQESVVDAISELGKFMDEQAKPLSNLPYTIGGSEGFIQYFFEYHMKVALGIPMSSKEGIEREVPVYTKTNNKADWVFTTKQKKKVVFEFKCESKSKEGSGMEAAVKADVEKVSGAGNLAAAYKDAEVAAIAMTHSPKAAAAMQGMGMVKHHEVKLLEGEVLTLWVKELGTSGGGDDDSGEDDPFDPKKTAGQRPGGEPSKQAKSGEEGKTTPSEASSSDEQPVPDTPTPAAAADTTKTDTTKKSKAKKLAEQLKKPFSSKKDKSSGPGGGSSAIAK